MVNKIVRLALACALLSSCSPKQVQEEETETLAEAYADCWYTGVSVNQWEVAASDSTNEFHVTGMISSDQTSHWDVIKKNFNWVVAENCMKCEVIHPEEDRYDFALADEFVNKAKQANLKVLGHCLIWHSQCAPWFHYDKEGKLVSPEVLRARMKEHITTIVNHFKGRIDAWDVVNEAFEDDGSLRKSLFYQILGEEYIPLAFQYAHEADPDIELYINDYSMLKPTKIQGICDFLRPLVEKGMPVSTIGFQGHMILADGANQIIQSYDSAIGCVEKLGLKVAFSEVDLSVLPNPYGFSGANISDQFAYRPEMDPYREGLPKEQEEEYTNFWVNFYKMLLKHKDTINRINFWCLNDANSWRNDYPIKGRIDYPTFYDRQCQPKPVIQKLIDLRKNNKELEIRN